ncbi:MarR family winged helix-turn-helix transcriptional regulator [Cryptosporangium arvum]|uniref:Transcriptional regulator n=1 Tax=Cryptosporangium arvum DSM 44712 TaxID=927661 RepID=A0A010ZUB3_9ACTN|nr:MarR family transcriptional regulator [Cryptosporangium arvum]EXG80777.1 transcriptional regulator [Cryptosporangium arvum DSM 44712]
MLGEELYVRIARLHRLIATDVVAGPSVAQARTLGRLLADGPQRVSALAAAERTAQPSMTALVDRMEKAGWVTRAPDPTDGRAVTVTVTERGAAEVAAVRVASGRALDERLALLSETDRTALRAALPALDVLLATD